MTLRKLNITRKSKSADQAGADISKAVEKLREDRQQMIATAAYYRAEKRGFNGGDEIQDWLEAESELDGISYN